MSHTFPPLILLASIYRLNANWKFHPGDDWPSMMATVANPDNVSAFAAQRSTNGTLAVMVICKYLTNTTPITVNLGNFIPGATTQIWQLTRANTITAGNQLQLNWPTDHTGWLLQSQTNSLAIGLATNWINVAGLAQTNQLTLPLNVTSGAVFFQLMRPWILIFFCQSSEARCLGRLCYVLVCVCPYWFSRYAEALLS